MSILRIVSFLLLSFSLSFAQEYYPKTDGVKTPNHEIIAFTNATIHVSPEETIESGILVIENNKIIAVGKTVSIPEKANIIDLKGKYIYPSFIDVYSDFGIEAPKSNRGQQGPQYDANRTGYYWNDHIRPETKAITHFSYNKEEAKELLKLGFGVVNTHRKDGIISGTGMLVALNQQGDLSNRLLVTESGQYLSFRKSKLSRQSYPGSIMGSMALIRQVFHDADWYSKGNIDTKDLALEAFIANKKQPQIFKAGNWLNDLRVDKLGDEFGVQYTIVGGGDEYQRVEEIKKTQATYIIPLNFPKAYDVENPLQASKINLKDLKHWNLAPTNPNTLAINNIPFAFSLAELKKKDDFKANVAKAITHGLTKEQALAALTTIPAKILKQENLVGSLNKGKLANFTITSGDIFDKETNIYEHWVLGIPNRFNDLDSKDFRGNYTLTVAAKTYELAITGTIESPKIELKQDTLKLKAKLNLKDNWVNIHFKENEAKTYTRLISRLDTNSKNLTGKVTLPNGQESTFIATYKDNIKEEVKDKKENTSNTPKLVKLSYPNMAYGFNETPKQQTILFKNVTVWTNEAEGILEETDVLIKDGKIAKIGKNLSYDSALIIDGTGKHLTTGIVDEHSHIATSSVNEGGQNSSAEVTIEDVVNSDDINIYRNLAGGVTTIQILHGSANPIGGRSALVKLKWGATPDKMLIPNAPKFIKFALGENVKQSNWNSYSRFPQTRMGVEQVYIDYFTRAKEYHTKKNSGKPYRKDPELEVLAEIINKERFISCHSYIQSEINMLMKVAEQFNFNINTFTHILEGYKVADKMKAHGVGGSTFSDWWAYKYEVNDAIPYNAAIMHNAGVTVALNSDDAEMSRRLNQEAAKAVKYGNVSEEDAWKFVTLNPAKLLHLDKNIGSIKVGKDADVVLWSDHPLSIYTKAEKTLIEGVVYFDIDRDKELRKKIQEERNILINMMIEHKANGGKTQQAKQWKRPHIHCDFEGDYQH